VFSIDGTLNSNSTPEPSTWALAGLSLGYFIRRQFVAKFAHPADKSSQKYQTEQGDDLLVATPLVYRVPARDSVSTRFHNVSRALS